MSTFATPRRFVVLTALGLALLLVANVVVLRPTAPTGHESDLLQGALYGVAFGFLLLGLVVAARERGGDRG